MQLPAALCDVTTTWCARFSLVTGVQPRKVTITSGDQTFCQSARFIFSTLARMLFCRTMMQSGHGMRNMTLQACALANTHVSKFVPTTNVTGNVVARCVQLQFAIAQQSRYYSAGCSWAGGWARRCLFQTETAARTRLQDFARRCRRLPSPPPLPIHPCALSSSASVYLDC